MLEFRQISRRFFIFFIFRYRYYNLSVEIVDSFGCSFTDHKQIVVDAPTANFTASSVSTNCPPLITQFQSINNVDVVEWEWDFGDGNQSIVESPSNLYTTSGDYDVSLVITNINKDFRALFFYNLCSTLFLL